MNCCYFVLGICGLSCDWRCGPCVPYLVPEEVSADQLVLIIWFAVAGMGWANTMWFVIAVLLFPDWFTGIELLGNFGCTACAVITDKFGVWCSCCVKWYLIFALFWWFPFTYSGCFGHFVLWLHLMLRCWAYPLLPYWWLLSKYACIHLSRFVP